MSSSLLESIVLLLVIIELGQHIRTLILYLSRKYLEKQLKEQLKKEQLMKQSEQLKEVSNINEEQFYTECDKLFHEESQEEQQIPEGKVASLNEDPKEDNEKKKMDKFSIRKYEKLN